MKLFCYERESCVSSAAWPHKLDWAQVAGRRGFEVYAGSDDHIVADVNFDDYSAREYCVEFFGKDAPSRIITEKEVIPTVRLFLSVAKRRKTLNSGVVLVIHPKY